jgi:chemotaxis protein methyltransferase CheR
VTNKISDAQLLQLGDVVARHLGLHFPKERWLDLQRGVCEAAEECGCQHDLERYADELLSPALTQRHLEVLAGRLTVGETYFFREKRSLEVLEREIVPKLIRAHAGSGRAIRIWSAGCATGEEPYSVAIVISRLMGLKKWNVEILATDLNSASLQKAYKGIYGEWSFRGNPPWVRSTYFEQVEEDRWAIAPAIKKMVTFAQLNLMNDAYPPVSNSPNSFDVILCRNVLMYLTAEGMRKVVRQLHRCLATDGWLIVSPTETGQELFSAFATVSFGDVTLYRKSAYRKSVARLRATPEAIVAALEPARTSRGQTTQKDSHREAGPQHTAAPAASYGQALALYEQGLYEEVERVICALPSGAGNHASAMLLLARTYANQGKLAAALALCDQAIAADKIAARAYYLRGTILQEKGCLPEALLAFKQTVYAEPEFMLGHFALGSLARKQGRLKESEKHFANVLLLLARYEPEDIVPESEGLSAGRLREMIAPTGQGAAANQTGQAAVRVPQPAGNLERSRR